MSETFQHVIFTRFNLAISFTGTKPTIIHDPEWLKYRFQIFRTSCYPSIVNQATQNFRWFVLFDPESPEWVWELMDREFPRATVVRTDRWEDGDLLKAVELHCEPSEKLLSTRLDSDDCIHRDYVDEIQKSAKTHPSGFLNFPIGYTMVAGRFYRISYPSNAFMSLLESRAGAKTILGVQHQLAHTVATVHEIPRKPLWVQVIHGTNVANDLYGIRNFNVDHAAFGILPTEDWGKSGAIASLKEAIICALRGLSRKTGVVRKLKALRGHK